MKKNINNNYQRLTVHLVNPEKKNKIQNTFTFNGVASEGDARATIRTMLQLPTESDVDLSNRIRKAYYNGKEFIFRPEETHNGWVVK